MACLGIVLLEGVTGHTGDCAAIGLVRAAFGLGIDVVQLSMEAFVGG